MIPREIMTIFIRKGSLRSPRLLGAVLAAALGLAACSTDLEPPFQIEDRGMLEGRLFFDADGDGLFDPLAGDQPLQGVQVIVRERGTTRTIAGGQTTSNAQGRFVIENLPVGTHDVFVDPASLPEGIVCQNPVPASVYRNEPAFLRVGVRLACLIRIDEAKLRPLNELVNVRGIVTMALGQGRVQGDDMYIQDSSGGIKVFGASLVGTGLQVGDLVDITGNVGTFNQELQLVTPRLNERVPGVGAPAPRVMTTAAAAAQGAPITRPDLGRLIRLERARLTAAFSGGGGRNAPFNDGSGAVEVRIEPGVIGTVADIAPRFTVNACYNVTGVIGSFNGVAQVKPRTMNDVQEVPCN
jgi:hypothetical protein